MKNELVKIEELIKKPMEEMGITVDSVEITVENKYKFLKITLDKINGIDLDTIVEATKIINPIIDEADIISDEYILDISSKERG